MRNATATTCYQPIVLHLIILILKLSECPICPLLRVHWYLLLALNARKVHAHEDTREIHAHETNAHQMHAREIYAYRSAGFSLGMKCQRTHLGPMQSSMSTMPDEASGADNLTQDAQTIDLTPCLRVHAYST
jgi:hypothetical protein